MILLATVAAGGRCLCVVRCIFQWVGLGVWLLMDPLPFFFFGTHTGHRRRRGSGPRSCTRRRSKACGGCSTGSTTRCRPPTPPRWDSTSSEAARNEEGCCSKPPTSVCVCVWCVLVVSCHYYSLLRGVSDRSAGY
jgi:hypothetical protein